jgi:DEP domain-containing protein 5
LFLDNLETIFKKSHFRFLVEGKIKATAPLTEIFEAMKNPINGVPFLEPMPSLPSCTFVSYDAVQWLLNRIEGIFNPLEMLEAMRK